MAIIQDQQSEIKALKSLVNKTEAKVSATADAIESGAASGLKLAEWAAKT